MTDARLGSGHFAGQVGRGLLLVALALSRAEAQSAPPAAEAVLDLARVVQTTLSSSPEVKLAELQAEAARGTLVSAGAPFDLALDTRGAANRSHSADPGSGAEAIQTDLTYSAGTQRLFRNGMSLESTVDLSRRGYSTSPASATANSVAVGLTLTVPLLRDRGGAVSAAAERVAFRQYRARLLDLRQTAAERVLLAVAAYWDYLAARQRLEVLQSSETRAQRTVEETRVLVQADERTTADLTQLMGNLASKRVARIAAEQDAVRARQELGLAMGMPAVSIPGLPSPGTEFPGLRAEPITGLRAEPLIETAYARRPDLAASEQDSDAAQVLMEAARNDLKPGLQLAVGTGYSAIGPGLGFGNFFGPLYRREPQLDASLQLIYRFPPSNSGARGRLLRDTSLHEQRRVIQDELRRRVAAAVAIAVEALLRGEAGMRESEQAVRLFEAGVQAEQRKFQLGVSTLFDMIQAQDALTNALLARIQSRRDYAVAIATLRFESGALLEGDLPNATVPLEALLLPP